MLRLTLALMIVGCGEGPASAPETTAPAPAAVGAPDLPNPCLANPCEATLIDPAVNPCVEAPASTAPEAP